MNNLYRCVVEENNDPCKLGRVKIRVVGVHSPKLKKAGEDAVRTDDLPWSPILASIGYVNGLGSNSIPIVGTWGYCMPLNDALNEFIMIGSIIGGLPGPNETDADGDEMGFRDTRGGEEDENGVSCLTEVNTDLFPVAVVADDDAIKFFRASPILETESATK